MPKTKTRKSVKNRFKITKTGKVLHRGQMGRHLKAKKNKSRQRRQKRIKQLSGTFAKKIKKMLPYR